MLRFVAAFAVLIWHYQHFSYIGEKPVDLVKSQLPLYSLLRPFYENGEYGVWVFWCISGFISSGNIVTRFPTDRSTAGLSLCFACLGYIRFISSR